MNEGLVWAIVGVGLLVVVARRRSAAIALVTLQALLLSIGALLLAPDRSGEFLAASLILLVRAVVLAGLLGWTLSRTREPRPVDEGAAPMLRFVATIALALAVAALVPSFGLGDATLEHATVALVVIGVATIVARRATLFQALGLLVAENGIALAAASVDGGMPIVIELGVALDVILVVAAATAFHERIFGEFGTGDTDVLRDLRD